MLPTCETMGRRDYVLLGFDFKPWLPQASVRSLGMSSLFAHPIRMFLTDFAEPGLHDQHGTQGFRHFQILLILLSKQWL